MLSIRTLAATLSMGALAACSGGDGGDDGNGGTGPNNYSLIIATSTSALSLAPGASATVDVTVTRGGGYPGNVTVVVQNLPAGVSGSCSPEVLTGTQTSSTCTVTVSQGAALGSSPASIKISGSGVNEATAPLLVNVVAPPGFTIAAVTSTVSIAQGASGQVTLNTTRSGGFTGGINLALENHPAGVTFAFDPNPATGGQATLTLSVGATTPANNYTLTIRGSATGLTDRTITITLTVLPAGAPGFTLSLSTAALTVAPGTEGTLTVTVQRTGGFAGAISFFTEGHPSGVTPTFVPSPTTGNTTTLTLAAGLAAPSGTATVTVRGDAAGLASQRVTFQLTIPTVAGYTLTVNPTALTIAAGGTAQSSVVTIQRSGGFAADVTLSLTGHPAGVTFSFNPTVVSGTSSTLLITVPAGVTAGPYTLTVRGNATGMTERTATLTLNVVASGTSITWRFCAPTPEPVFFAFQDGSSPFTVVTRAGDGSYTMSLATGRGAVVIVQPGLPSSDDDLTVPRAARVRPAWPSSLRPARGSRFLAQQATDYTTFAHYATTAEFQAMAQAQCSVLSHKTVNGTVANVPGTMAYAVALGGGFVLGLPGVSTNSFTLTDVLDGPRDLVAGRVVFTGDEGAADRLIIRRDQNPANGSTMPVLDFGGTEWFAPVTATATLAGMPAGAQAEVTSAFSTANGTATLLGVSPRSASTSHPYTGVPGAQLRSGDLHAIIGETSVDGSGRGFVSALYSRDAVARTLTFPADMPAPQVGVFSTTPVLRLRAAGAMGGPGSAVGGYVYVQLIQATASRAFVFSQTRGYIGTTQNFEVRTLVLTGLTGWNEALYGVAAGSLVDWSVDYRSAGDEFVPADGATLRWIWFSGAFMP